MIDFEAARATMVESQLRTDRVTDRRILTVLGFWVVLNIVFGVGVVSIAGTKGDIAWEAHIGGVLFGLLCFGFFDTSRRLPVLEQP